MSIFRTQFDIQGLNISRFILDLKSNDIMLFNLKRLSHDHIEVDITSGDMSAFYNVAKKYNFKILPKRMSPKLFLVTFFKNNLIFALSILFIFLAVMVSNNFIFKFEIVGDVCDSSKEKISRVLKESKILVGKPKSQYDLDEMKLLLLNNVDDISLVSLSIYGNTILINAKEKIDDSQIVYDFQPIVAEYDMIIESLNLISGTANASIGQTIKKGDIIVQPYVFVGDKKIAVEAKADIIAYVEIVQTNRYFENHVEYVKNQKCIKSSYLSIFGQDILKDEIAKTFSTSGRVFENENILVPYKNFEVKVDEQLICENLLLPIKKTTITFYELKAIDVFVPFDENIKQNLIEENKKIIYNQVGIKYALDPNRIEFDSVLIENEDCFYVSTYLKTSVRF